MEVKNFDSNKHQDGGAILTQEEKKKEWEFFYQHIVKIPETVRKVKRIIKMCNRRLQSIKYFFVDGKAVIVRRKKKPQNR